MYSEKNFFKFENEKFQKIILNFHSKNKKIKKLLN